jgi:hypothetical protein
VAVLKNMTKITELCATVNQTVKGHNLRLLILDEADFPAACAAAVEAVSHHYLSPERIANLLKRFGKTKAAAYLLEKLPTSTKERSGALGEILGTEYIDECTGYKAPIKRLRWKDHREMSMRGDDVIAVKLPAESQSVSFLKAEVKSRASLASQTITEARGALNGEGGLPSPHALEFVADRLQELGDEKLSDAITLAMLTGISAKQVKHLLFTFSGNAPDSFLHADLSAYKGSIEQSAAGLRIKKHQDFIAAVFDAVKARHAT